MSGTYGSLLQTGLGAAIALVGAIIAPLVTTRSQRRADDERRRAERVRAVHEQQADALARLQQALMGWSRLMGRCWHDDQIRFRAPADWDEAASNELQEREGEALREARMLSNRVLDDEVRREVTDLFEMVVTTMPLTSRPTENGMAVAQAHQQAAIYAFVAVQELIGETWRTLVAERLAA